MTIGRLAKAAGVNVETIRYYQRRKLIAEPRKPPGGQRRYAAAVVGQIAFIRRAQQLGFSLDEIAGLIACRGDGDCRRARAIAESKLHVLEARIAELERMRAGLEGLVTACRETGGRKGCPILAALAGDAPG